MIKISSLERNLTQTHRPMLKPISIKQSKFFENTANKAVPRKSKHSRHAIHIALVRNQNGTKETSRKVVSLV